MVNGRSPEKFNAFKQVVNKEFLKKVSTPSRSELKDGDSISLPIASGHKS
jgi:hypothetical protein